MKSTDLINTLYELDKVETRQEMFDWSIRQTDESFTSGDFDSWNQVFEQVDASRLTASSIVALLRSTFMARNRLPARAVFIKNQVVIDKMKATRADAEVMLKSLE